MFSISTVWNAWRHKTAQSMVAELKDLGFDRLELSFGLPSKMVADISLMVEEGEIAVGSLHNYCPSPILRDGHSLSHSILPLSNTDEEERKWAVRQTMRTIETAHSLGASAVVLHMGKVLIRPISPKLMMLAENGEVQSGRSERLRSKLRKRRELKKELYLEQAAKSLRDLAPHAEELGIKLGIENRYYPEEIPDLNEIGQLIEWTKSSAVGYWHDMGHAAVKENIGWGGHLEYLERYGDRLIGMHIHDVILTRDHRAPLQGELDFSPLVEYMREDLLKVVEVHPIATAEEIKNGLAFLLRLIGEVGSEPEASDKISME
jgi:sugar phosphate isomerase/epimerase